MGEFDEIAGLGCGSRGDIEKTEIRSRRLASTSFHDIGCRGYCRAPKLRLKSEAFSVGKPLGRVVGAANEFVGEYEYAQPSVISAHRRGASQDRRHILCP